MCISGNISRNSIVLAEDIARIDGQSGTYNLTDVRYPRLSDLDEAIAQVHEQPIRFGFPLSLVKLGALGGDLLKKVKLPSPLYTARLNKMTATLTFDDHAARKDVGWNPQSVLSKAASILPRQ